MESSAIAMEVWNKIKLSEALEKIVGGGTPSKSEPKYWSGNIPWASVKDMSDGVYRLSSTVDYITELGLQNSATNLIPKGTVIISTRMGLGRCFRSDKDIAINQDLKALFPNELIISDYLLWLIVYLGSKIESMGTGTTVKGIRLEQLRDLDINLPPLPTQRKIAAILSSYDDLIENNTRRIKILEEMAQALYREWFVKFRFPGHEKVKMVESELGMVPEGWEVKEMREVADVIDCLHSKKPLEFKDGTKTLLQLFNIADSGKLDLSKRFFISDDDYLCWTTRIEASCGDCVVTNVGRIAAVAQIPEGERVALGRNMTAIRPKNGIMTPTYLIEYLLSPHMDNEVQKKKDAGTIMDSLNVKGIVILSVPIPSGDLMKTFERITRPIRRRIELLMNQNTNLRHTRDLLLPKLISGEINVKKLDISTINNNKS